MASVKKVGRNAFCECGSGKKYKHCCAVNSIAINSIRLSPQLETQLIGQLNTAIDLHDNLQLAEAEVIYRQILQLQPHNAEALHLLGLIAYQTSNNTAAVELISKAIAFKPDFARAYNNLSLAKEKLGKIAEAKAHIEKAIALNPKFEMAYTNYASLLHTHYQNHIEAERYNLKAIEINPNFAIAHHNLAIAYLKQNQLAKALKHYRLAYTLDKSDDLKLQNAIFPMQLSGENGEDEIDEAIKEYSNRYETPLKKEWGNYLNEIIKNRKLKVGYVSADFRIHPIANFIEPLLINHNRAEFEIYGYYSNDHRDAVTDRFESYFDHWLECFYYSDEALAKQIREDKIDILIDLAGHTEGNRLLVFARKPAPIQVSWMGFVGSVGLQAIDYRISDKHLEPNDCSFTCTEKPWLLSPAWYAYQPCIKSAELIHAVEMNVKVTPAISNKYITFGSLNNTAKINAKVIALWSKILLTIPDSKLLLIVKNQGDIRKNIYYEFLLHGIRDDRLIFLDYSNDNHYLIYHQIDIALDPFPYNGGTTSCDGLWMGVPFITLTGNVVRARMGVSIATNVGHPEWIAETEDEYIKKAVNLASDIDKLNSLRLNLRAEFKNSPLMDSAGLTKKFETALRRMWEVYCDK